MDPRRSGTSSFYDNVPPPGLNTHNPRPSSSSQRYQDNPPPSNASVSASMRGRRDSAASGQLLQQGRADTPGGGYNSTSYTNAGRSEPVKGWDDEEMGLGAGAGPHSPGTPNEPEGWDVYADFNNAGPKYSSGYAQDNAYQPLDHPHPKGAGTDAASLSNPGAPGHVEMVTVPALGAEWKSSELAAMTSSGKRAARASERGAAWTAWRRGNKGMCGIPWLTRKFLTFFLFFLIIIVGVTLAIVLPRVPGFALSVDTPLANATGDFAKSIPTLFVSAPAANFSFPALAVLQLNTGSSFLALHLSQIKAQVSDSQTGRVVATGELASQVAKAKAFVPLSIPMNFSYTAINSSDQTWINWHTACQNPINIVGNKRPGVNFVLSISYYIRGLLGQQHTSTDVLNANCPIVLPTNSA